MCAMTSRLYSTLTNHSNRDFAAKSEQQALVVDGFVLASVSLQALPPALIPVQQRNALAHCVQPERAHESLGRVLVVEVVQRLGQARCEAANEKRDMLLFGQCPRVECILNAS